MGDFLEQIPVVSNIVAIFPSMVAVTFMLLFFFSGKRFYFFFIMQDFEGQRLAEKLYQFIIILFAVS